MLKRTIYRFTTRGPRASTTLSTIRRLFVPDAAACVGKAEMQHRRRADLDLHRPTTDSQLTAGHAGAPCVCVLPTSGEKKPLPGTRHIPNQCHSASPQLLQEVTLERAHRPTFCCCTTAKGESRASMCRRSNLWQSLNPAPNTSLQARARIRRALPQMLRLPQQAPGGPCPISWESLDVACCVQTSPLPLEHRTERDSSISIKPSRKSPRKPASQHVKATHPVPIHRARTSA